MTSLRMSLALPLFIFAILVHHKYYYTIIINFVGVLAIILVFFLFRDCDACYFVLPLSIFIYIISFAVGLIIDSIKKKSLSK